MFNHQLAVLTIVIALFGSNIAYKSYQDYKVYSVHAKDESDLNLLQSISKNFTGIDFWDRLHHDTNTSYRVMVKPDSIENFVQLLNANKIENQEIIGNVQKVVESERLLNIQPLKLRKIRRRTGPTIDFEHFWTYDEVVAYLNYLAGKFPLVANVSMEGKSEEDRDIPQIQIQGEELTMKPQIILIDATSHAREWITTMFAIYIIYELVENREKNLHLLQNINYIVVPIVNPDGYIFSHENDRFWRKNRQKLEDTDCIGIDINRNFKFHWDTEGGSSEDPCDEDYRGPKPEATKEVEHLSTLLQSLVNVKLYLTLHAYGEYILYPYSYSHKETIYDFETHQLLGTLVRAEIDKYNSQHYKKADYKVGQSANMLFVTSGGSDDYAAGSLRLPFVFSIELPGGGTYGFDIPPGEINQLVRSSFMAINVFGKYFAHKI